MFSSQLLYSVFSYIFLVRMNLLLSIFKIFTYIYMFYILIILILDYPYNICRFFPFDLLPRLLLRCLFTFLYLLYFSLILLYFWSYSSRLYKDYSQSLVLLSVTLLWCFMIPVSFKNFRCPLFSVKDVSLMLC